MEQQEQGLADIVAGQGVQHVPDFARPPRCRGKDGRRRIRFRVGRAPVKLLLPLGLWRRFRLLRLGFGRGLHLTPRRFVLFGNVRLLVIVRVHGDDFKTALPLGARSQLVGGQNRRPNVLARALVLVIRTGAADAQVVAAEPPVKSDVILPLPGYYRIELARGGFEWYDKTIEEALLSTLTDRAIEIKEAPLGQRHGQTSLRVSRNSNSGIINCRDEKAHRKQADLRHNSSTTEAKHRPP